MTVLDFLREKLPSSVHRRLREAVTRVRTESFSHDLNRLALYFHTDKWGGHWYTQHYKRYFEPLRKSRLNLLEIGVGGYEHEWGAESLRMWKYYFRNARIVGIDIHDKTRFRERRIDIRQCDQTDSNQLRQISEEYGGFDIIVDDGSHINEHVVTTFKILFPLMRPGGIYAIEDTQTAYWPSWGGGEDNPRSTMAFFKGLADGLNHAEFPREGYTPNYFDQNIFEIALFHNLIIVRKGNNVERTNAPSLIQQELDLVRSGPADMTAPNWN